MSGKANPHGLTDLEYRFCWAYAKTLHLGDSVAQAGFKCKYPSEFGSNLLKKSRIRAYLQEILDLSTVTILNEIVHIAFANITDVLTLDENGVTVIPSEQWSDRAKAAVKSVKVRTRSKVLKNGSTVTTVETEVTMYDRLSALDKLMRKLGMYPTQSDVLSLIEAMAQNGLLVPGQADVVTGGIAGIRERLRELN